MTNEQLIQEAAQRIAKAVVTVDALATAGKLNPQQTEKFIDYVIDQSMMKSNVRVVRFKPETLEINKIGLAARVAMPATEATDPRLRRGVTTSKVTITPKEIIVPWEVSDTVADVNLEGAALLEHIVQMMGRQSANDTEDYSFNGDVVGPAVLESTWMEGGSGTQYVLDRYMQMGDGWLRQADAGHVYDAGGANIGPSIFSRMLNTLPTKWRRNRGDLRFMLSPDLEQLYREKTSTRATAQGDVAGQTDMVLKPFGVPLIAAPLFPHLPSIVQHVTLNAAGGAAIPLRYAPIVSAVEVVTPTTLGALPVTPYSSATDYLMDYTNGTIEARGGGVLAAGGAVKITYSAQPQIMLTHMQNFIYAIGRDIRIEKDRDIYKRVNQYVITLKIAALIEETDAVVKAINVGTGV